jgi:hypothetical protein
VDIIFAHGAVAQSRRLEGYSVENRIKMMLLLDLDEKPSVLDENAIFPAAKDHLRTSRQGHSSTV